MLVEQSQKANGPTRWNSRQTCRCGPKENSEWKSVVKNRRFFDTLSHKHNRKSLPVSEGDSNRNIVTLLQSHLPHGVIAGQQELWFDNMTNHPSIPFYFSWAIPCQYTSCYRGTALFFLPLADGSQNTFIKCKQSFGKKYVHTGSLQRKYDVQNRLSFKKR